MLAAAVAWSTAGLFVRVVDLDSWTILFWRGLFASGALLVRSLKDMAGKVTIAKVNIDENPGIASKYQIRSIPTLMLFKNGKPVATRMGSLPKQALYQWVEQTIA